MSNWRAKPAPFTSSFLNPFCANSRGIKGLATAVSAGYTQYAYAFVAFDAEQIESEGCQGG
jgi:hypothetical protein